MLLCVHVVNPRDIAEERNKKQTKQKKFLRSVHGASYRTLGVLIGSNTSGWGGGVCVCVCACLCVYVCGGCFYVCGVREFLCLEAVCTWYVYCVYVNVCIDCVC